jgi:hypothetical protein
MRITKADIRRADELIAQGFAELCESGIEVEIHRTKILYWHPMMHAYSKKMRKRPRDLIREWWQTIKNPKTGSDYFIEPTAEGWSEQGALGERSRAGRDTALPAIRAAAPPGNDREGASPERLAAMRAHYEQQEHKPDNDRESAFTLADDDLAEHIAYILAPMFENERFHPSRELDPYWAKIVDKIQGKPPESGLQK